MIKKLIKNIDTRDIFIIIGLITMCSGLWILKPWISLTVCGGFILYQALIIEARK